jgi:hypothetical protein
VTHPAYAAARTHTAPGLVDLNEAGRQDEASEFIPKRANVTEFRGFACAYAVDTYYDRLTTNCVE